MGDVIISYPFVIIQNYCRYLPAPLSGDLLYLIIVSVFVMVKLASVLADPVDPFSPLEGTVATLAFGGLWDGNQENEEKTE